MFSTIAHVHHARSHHSFVIDTSQSNLIFTNNIQAHVRGLKAATFLDFAGFVTAVVLGALAMNGAGALPIGIVAGGVLAGGGGMGIVHLALANVLLASVRKAEKNGSFESQDRDLY